MKKTILIVDDNVMMQKFLQQFLQEKYDVVTKSDGMLALAWIEEGNIPDIIISDFDMPGYNGLELIKSIRISTIYSHIPMIILSGNEKSEFRIECLRQGADDYILKPFNPEELIIRIEKNLAQTYEKYKG